MLFDEFAAWALQKGLDMLDDGDEEGEESLVRAHKSAEQVAAKGARDTKKALAKQKAAGGRPANAAESGGIPTYISLAKELPTGKDDADKAERKTLFRLFDPNGNGFLSLAEIDKGLIVQFDLADDGD